MLMSLNADGILDVVLSDHDREGWQTNHPDIHHDIQRKVLDEACNRGFAAPDVHLFFANGARVCTIRLVKVLTYEVREDA
jgi:hypothetical protein